MGEQNGADLECVDDRASPLGLYLKLEERFS